MKTIIERVRNAPPLVHHLTNYVTVNDCANTVLAAGGAPLMADDISEVEEIVAISQALYINIGTPNGRTVESMVKAGKKANNLGLPVVLDPVGMGATHFRNEVINRLLKEVDFAIVKGNMSEIRGLYQSETNTGGVDVMAEDMVDMGNLEEAVAFAKTVAKKLCITLVITGAIDIVTDGERAAVVKNGHPLMSRVTGTGCMTGSIIATFVGANSEAPYVSAIAALVKMGLAGERAYREMKEKGEGVSSYKRYLIDGIDLIGSEEMEAGGIVEYL
jgi:hydroxyethylthiazole kinase